MKTAPVGKTETMSKGFLWEGLQVGLIAAMFITAIARWRSVPDRLPVHWGASGEVDRYGGRFEGLLLLPIIVLTLYLLLLAVPHIDPAKANYASFRGPYMTIRVVLVLFMGFLYLLMNLSIENGDGIPLDRMVLGAAALILLVLGLVMGKFRPNYTAGIRTPWTLTSKKSWVKTHRLGGWVFIAAGLGTGIAATFSGLAAIITMSVILIPGIIWLTAYSYVVWKGDTDRIAAHDTAPAKEDEQSKGNGPVAGAGPKASLD